MTKLAIASDHAGYDLKERIKRKYEGQVEWLDLGTDSEKSVDYPDFAKKMGEAITNGDAKYGVLICGSGIGMSIGVNRFPAVRGALCMTIEMARLARQHNDANVLVLGSRLIDMPRAFDCVQTFLIAEFEGGRHQRRVEKLG